MSQHTHTPVFSPSKKETMRALVHGHRFRTESREGQWPYVMSKCVCNDIVITGRDQRTLSVVEQQDKPLT